MRIQTLSVTGLFDVLNHTIDLKMDDRITIIHGPNGVGKTTFLRLVAALFRRNYADLSSIPFKSLVATFDDGRALKVSKYQTTLVPTKDTESGLLFQLNEDWQEIERFNLRIEGPQAHHYSHLRLERFIPGLIQTGPEQWRYRRTGEVLTWPMVLERFASELPPSFRQPPEPPWFLELLASVPVRLIDTQRLLTHGPRRYANSEEVRDELIPAVAADSRALVRTIQEAVTEYASLSQSLDRTFPGRLLERLTEYERTPEVVAELSGLVATLKALEQQTATLSKAGLLDREQTAYLPSVPPGLEHVMAPVLSVYVEDVEKKLAVFDVLAAKLDLLTSMINARFAYKQVRIDRQKGFIFATSTGSELPPTALSSGEQHVLVLFWELLFRLHPNSLVLIDEPELSLHIAWQQTFLQDLQRILRLDPLDILIATHSPEIVNDRWDLTVELTGPEIK